MRLFVLLFLSLPFMASTQNYQDIYKEKPVDSLKYYKEKLAGVQRQMRDSMTQSEGYQTALQGMLRHQSRTDNYTSFTIFTETLQGDYTNFNRQLQNTGFSPLQGPTQRFGLGFTIKTNRTILDIYIVTFSQGKKAKKVGESLTSTVNNLFQFNLGFDLAKSRNFNVYPYAGLSMRDATLTYKKSVPENASPTTFLDLMQDEYTSANSMKVGYEAGLGMDIKIAGRKESRGGTMLFAKVGTNGPIGKEKYEINDNSFDPGITYGQWLVALGFKFFGRH